MRLTAIALMMIVSMFMAAAAGSAAAQVNMEKLMNPAQLNETAPDKFQGQIRHIQGRIYCRGHKSMGTQWSRSFL